MDASFDKQPNSSSNGVARTAIGLSRAIVRHCPICGGGGIFENWFSLKKQCPSCGSIFEPEDGYMLGSYVVNLGLTAVTGVLFAFGVVFGTDLSVVTIQIAAVALVIGLPIILYGHAQLFWISIDLMFNSTEKFDPNRIRHT